MLPLDQYQHTKQLLELDACRSAHPRKLPAEACQITTSLRYSDWVESLSGYPDRRFRGYIQAGFRVGFNPKCTLASCSRNMVSADEHPEVVTKYLQEEVEKGRVIHLELEAGRALGVHVSPFGVIPKKSKPNKWRLILDLSSPTGHSVNEGIDKELSTLKYVSVDEVVARVLSQGKGAMLAKMDIKQAYRNIPVHPNDRHLLGMKWDNFLYVDATLPFGLRSAPFIFQQWRMHFSG